MPSQCLGLKIPIGIEGTTAIDVGCGEGWTSIELAQKKVRVISVDISEKLLHNAQRNFSQHLPGHASPFLIQAACTDLPLSGETSDLAACTEVIEHTTETEKLLSELHRVLIPGGYCVLSFPVRWVENTIAFFSPRFLAFSGHVKQFSLQKMQALLLAAGFKIISVQNRYFEWSLFWLVRSILQQIPEVDRRGAFFGDKTTSPKWDRFSSLYASFWRRVSSNPLGRIFVQLGNYVVPKSYFLLLQKNCP